MTSNCQGRGGGASTTNESQVIFACCTEIAESSCRKGPFDVTTSNCLSGNAVHISLTPSTLARPC